MTSFNVVQGDINDTIVVILSGVQDLTTVTNVVGVLVNRISRVTVPATVTSAVARTVTIALGGGSGWLATATDGAWQLETQVTWGDGTKLTWPAQGTDVVNVRIA